MWKVFMHRNFSFPLLHCYSAMDVLQMQMQHCNKYQNNQDLSHPSGSDILPIREKFSAWPPSPLVLLCCSVDSIIFYQCRQTIIRSLRESLILFSNSLPATHPARFSDTDNSKRTKNEKVSPNLLGCKILENCIFIRCCVGVGDACFFLTMRCFPILNDAIFCSMFFNF